MQVTNLIAWVEPNKLRPSWSARWRHGVTEPTSRTLYIWQWSHDRWTFTANPPIEVRTTLNNYSWRCDVTASVETAYGKRLASLTCEDSHTAIMDVLEQVSHHIVRVKQAHHCLTNHAVRMQDALAHISVTTAPHEEHCANH